MEKTAVGELRNLDRKEKQLEENKKKLVERRDTFKEKQRRKEKAGNGQYRGEVRNIERKKSLKEMKENV